MKKDIQAVLFDLDGTLADTAPDLGGALNQLRREENLPEIPIATMRRAASRGIAGLLAMGFTNNSMDQKEQAELYESLRARFLVLYEQRLCDQVKLFPHARETLLFLSKANIPWGIVTNKLSYLAEPLMSYLGILEDASCAVYGDTTGERKPQPAPLLYAAHHMHIPAPCCLYVGDSIYDVQAARASRMPAAIVAYGHENPADLAREDGWTPLACLSELQTYWSAEHSL